MKKFFGTGLLLVSLLMVMAIQTGYSKPMSGDHDVGIVYTISIYNLTKISPIIADGIVYSTAFSFAQSKEVDYTHVITPVMTVSSPRESYLIARGVSVPCK